MWNLLLALISFWGSLTVAGEAQETPKRAPIVPEAEARFAYLSHSPEETDASFATTMEFSDINFGRFSRVAVQEPQINEPRNRVQEPIFAARRLLLRQTFDSVAAGQRSYLVTVIVDRQNPTGLYKQTVSSQDSAGATFQQVNHLAQIWKYWWNSHHEREGHGQRLLNSDPMTEEQLLLLLPTLSWKLDTTYEWPLIWGLHSHHARGVRLASTIRCADREQVKVPAGSFDCWQIDALAEGHHSRFALEVAPPHRLVSYSGDGGRTLQLMPK